MLNRSTSALIRPSILRRNFNPALISSQLTTIQHHLIKIQQFSTTTNLSNKLKESKEYIPNAKIIIDPKTGKKTLEKPMNVNFDLPDPLAPQRRAKQSFVAFCIIMSISLFGIFNYEKVSSPVMNATMYFLRRSEVARSKLGKEITFDGIFPWIKGELNTMKGNVDIKVKVSGSLDSAWMHLKANRNTRAHAFEISQWDLKFENGETYDLLKDASIALIF